MIKILSECETDIFKSIAFFLMEDISAIEKEKDKEKEKMKIYNFKPVGKAVLHRILGLRDNYTIKNPEPPKECRNCPFFKEMQIYKAFPESPEYKDARKKCRQCDNYQTYHCWDVKSSPIYKQYINENNRYGSGKRLKFNAILLFLTYHMICTDQYGIMNNISITELSETLGCSKKAVRYNNDLLQEYGYIYLSKGDYPGTVNICLKEYTSYFKSAKEGGRGFFTLSKELYFSLLRLESSNQLRIILKLLLDNDSVISLFPGEVTESYQDMRLYLPKYCKRNVIQKALNSIDTAICTIKLSLHTVHFKLNPNFDGKKVKQNLRQNNLAILKKDISSVKSSIKEALRLKQIPKFTDHFFSSIQQTTDNITYEPLEITDKQFEDLADISLDYSTDMVLTAVAAIYYNIICHQQTIRNLGGLIRETIKSNINSFPLTVTLS